MRESRSHALVVADDPSILGEASLALRNAGFEVRPAANGSAALVVLAGPASDASAVRAVGMLRIDLTRHEVLLDRRPIDVTASEFRLLALLAGSPGTVFTRRQIMEHVWEGPYFGDGHAVDTHVLNLRRKIEDDPARPRRLLTVRGVGFKLAAPAP